MNPAVKKEYDRLERAQFTAGTEEERERYAEILRLTRAQMADDTASNDRARFGGRRTLSLDRFAESGFEPGPERGPSRAVREEQEALEVGMAPFLSALPMDEADALRLIYRYSYSYRDTASRLHLTTPSLQRRVKRAIKLLRNALLEAVGMKDEEGEAP